MLASSLPVFCQSASEFDKPIVNGERALRFVVNPAGVNPASLNVEVFYTEDAGSLNNLNNTNLGRGKPVLIRIENSLLQAVFVFPHPDFPTDPNRRLYILGRGGIQIADAVVEAQINLSSMTQTLGDSSTQGLPPDSPMDARPVVHSKGTCIYYKVRIRRSGNTVFQSEMLNFRMPDSYNIAIAGDSYGAGEGAPQDEFELTGNNDDMWSEKDCHRSRKSGLVRGVKRFIARHPDVAVDYIHVACTGATMANMTEEQDHAIAAFPFEDTKKPQFDAIEEDFLEERDHSELNLLLLSVGGNDAGFGGFVTDFILGPGNAAATQGLALDITLTLADVARSYSDLDEEFAARFPWAKIAITTYPDPTNGPRDRCGRANDVADFAFVYSCCLVEVNQVTNPVAEYTFMSERFVRALNLTIRSGANAENEANSFQDWYVIDVESRMGAHGFCACDEPFINRLSMSIATQGDANGVVHPTDDGYREVYREPVGNKIGEIYQDFWVERKGGILLAILLGLDSEAIPESCDLTSRGSGTYFPRLVATHPKFAWLSELLKNSKISAALRTGDLERLRNMDEVKRAIDERDLRAIYNELFPNKLPVPRRRVPRVIPAAIEAQTKFGNYIRSKEYVDLRSRVLKNRPRQRVSKPDGLDRMFNRSNKPIIPKR